MTEPSNSDLFPERVEALALRIGMLAPGVGAYSTAARLVAANAETRWLVEFEPRRIADSDVLRALRVAKVTSAPDARVLARIYPGTDIESLSLSARQELQRKHDPAPRGRMVGPQFLPTELQKLNSIANPEERLTANRREQARVKAEAAEERARRLADYLARQSVEHAA